MAGTWWKDHPGSGSSRKSNATTSRVVVLLLVALTAAAAFAAFRSTASGQSHILWSVTRSRAVYGGRYGTEVIANLSDFKSGLLSTVLDAFDDKRNKTLDPQVSPRLI
jgi:hypothetical protein